MKLMKSDECRAWKTIKHYNYYVSLQWWVALEFFTKIYGNKRINMNWTWPTTKRWSIKNTTMSELIDNSCMKKHYQMTRPRKHGSPKGVCSVYLFRILNWSDRSLIAISNTLLSALVTYLQPSSHNVFWKKLYITGTGYCQALKLVKPWFAVGLKTPKRAKLQISLWAKWWGNVKLWSLCTFAASSSNKTTWKIVFFFV